MTQEASMLCNATTVARMAKHRLLIFMTCSLNRRRSPLEFGACRMVRPVNQHVAIQARPGVRLSSRTVVRQRLHTIDRRRVSIRQVRAAVDRRAVITGVAFLAQPGHPRFQQWRVSGTVGRMAVGAIVDNRAVFPQERPAFLGMTGVAGFVDRVLDEKLRPGRAMRVMAIGAHYLAGKYRVRRNAVNLRALSLVAGETYIWLRGFGQNWIAGDMDRMAVAAGYIAALMLASGPMRARQDFWIVAGKT